MKHNNPQVVRILRRLSEAKGYLELGMTRHALGRLEGIRDWGPFTVAAEMLRGEAARREHRFAAAADSFETAARMLHTPHDKPVWLTLSMCYRQAGDTDRAIESLAHARGARPPKAKPQAN